MTVELSKQDQYYVIQAVAEFAHVNEDDVYRIVTALQRHSEALYMAHVAEAVAYGNMRWLRAIAGGDHVNQDICARAAQVLAWVEEAVHDD